MKLGSAKLSDLLVRTSEWVEIHPTQSYREVTVRLWGKGVTLRREVTGSEIKANQRSVVRCGQFILSRIDARNGALGLVPPELDEAVVSNDFPAFEVRADRLLPQYLGWLSKTPTFVDLCRAASEGTTNRVRLQEERFLSATIPLPPLAEQRRIVAKIDQLAAKIAEARGLREHSSLVADSLVAREIARLFNADQDGRWQRGRLGDVVADDRYGTSEKTNDDTSGTPILRMGNIQNGRLDVANLKYLHLSAADRDKLLLTRGDILVNRTNSAELVGKCAVFDDEGEYGFASYLIRLRLDDSRADPLLVAMYINSPIGRAYMFNERKQMTGQANVNATKLKALPLALPPLDEQRRIVAYLEDLQAKVDRLKALQSQTAAGLDALMPAILDKAFKGEL